MSAVQTQKKFDYKEIDSEGEEILEVLSAAPRFNRYMYETILPYCKGNILEIGSGIGNISEQFLSDGYDLTLSDIRQSYLDSLRNKFSGNDHVKNMLLLDIVDPDFDTKFKEFFGTFDTVFALNVVEHIEDQVLALNNIAKLLKSGGNAVILVPSYQFLYNKLDEELYHYRRYNRESLRKVFEETDRYQIKKCFHFNFAGIFGWFISGKLQKNKSLPEGQVKLYNMLVPIFKLVDNIIFHTMGLSTICVGTKK